MISPPWFQYWLQPNMVNIIYAVAHKTISLKIFYTWYIPAHWLTKCDSLRKLVRRSGFLARLFHVLWHDHWLMNLVTYLWLVSLGWKSCSYHNLLQKLCLTDKSISLAWAKAKGHRSQPECHQASPLTATGVPLRRPYLHAASKQTTQQNVDFNVITGEEVSKTDPQLTVHYLFRLVFWNEYWSIIAFFETYGSENKNCHFFVLTSTYLLQYSQ